ncbi:alpha-L-arabinofuranosidase C-terminal domain-containing protein [Ferruginibacter sp.]
MFSANSGDYYIDKVITKNDTDSLLSGSCVYNSKSGDIIIKLVNAGKENKAFKINLGAFSKNLQTATVTQLSGAATAENSFKKRENIIPVTTVFQAAKKFAYSAPAVSVTVISIKTR